MVKYNFSFTEDEIFAIWVCLTSSYKTAILPLQIDIDNLLDKHNFEEIVNNASFSDSSCLLCDSLEELYSGC